MMFKHSRVLVVNPKRLRADQDTAVPEQTAHGVAVALCGHEGTRLVQGREDL